MPALDREPTVEECLIYRLNLDFVISNLKFSTIHHDAVVDGTMDAAWQEQASILSDQIATLDRFPHDNRMIIQIRQGLEKELEDTKMQIERAQDPNEKKRCQGMCDMHHTFTDSLERMIPLLKIHCPDSIESQRKDDPELIDAFEGKSYPMYGVPLMEDKAQAASCPVPNHEGSAGTCPVPHK